MDQESEKKRPNYSADTRVGNWNEDLAIEEEKLKLFLRKRERNELLVQKSRQLFCNILREVTLSYSNTSIHFGDTVQIVAPDMPSSRSCKEMGVVLAGLITEKEVDYFQKLSDGCGLTFSPVLVPCVRNTFNIVSADNVDRHGQTLLLGQDFMLRCVETQNDIPLYVQSPVISLSGLKGPSNHQAVNLTCHPSTYSRWRALSADHHIRFETIGTPVPANVRVLINQPASNQNMAVEFGSWCITFFGQECGVSVHTFKDIFRRETAENILIIRIMLSKDPEMEEEPED